MCDGCLLLCEVNNRQCVVATDFYVEKFLLASGMCFSDGLLFGVKQAAYVKCLTARYFRLKFTTCNM